MRSRRREDDIEKISEAETGKSEENSTRIMNCGKGGGSVETSSS